MPRKKKNFYSTDKYTSTILSLFKSSPKKTLNYKQICMHAARTDEDQIFIAQLGLKRGHRNCLRAARAKNEKQIFSPRCAQGQKQNFLCAARTKLTIFLRAARAKWNIFLRAARAK